MKKDVVIWHNGTLTYSYSADEYRITTLSEDVSLSTFFDMLMVLFKRK